MKAISLYTCTCSLIYFKFIEYNEVYIPLNQVNVEVDSGSIRESIIEGGSNKDC